ncbi:UNVERIFIED_CONTAM: peroxiredoxin (alkyl hydroperoxide reductase subunit C) [Acetivibrio alkalicellulosi]
MELDCLKNKSLTIGMEAPDFSAETTFGKMDFSCFKGKWVVFFSHPGDFTPVCTTEFIAFAQLAPYFAQKNVQLLGLSIDSNPSHLAWAYNIYINTGIHITFPIVADRDGKIAKLYGMIFPEVSATETVRTVYVIDEKQIIRAVLNYPMTNGRNIPEILRLVEALQTSDKEKVATPANWIPGQPVIVPPPKTYNELLERIKCSKDLKCIDWYLCYKKLPPRVCDCACENSE